MGTVHVHDSRPDRATPAWTDEQGYGPVVMAARQRRPLAVGDTVTLIDGSRWPVVGFRLKSSLRSWRQDVVIGELAAPPVPSSVLIVEIHRQWAASRDAVA